MQICDASSKMIFEPDRKSGVTMIEIMVVISLIVFLYSIAIPQFAMRSGSEAATKVQRLADDIRSAFDLAALNNK
jgi:prepilin-type N-terminal cleavage/methylation domain-containing protein